MTQPRETTCTHPKTRSVTRRWPIPTPNTVNAHNATTKATPHTPHNTRYHYKYCSGCSAMAIGTTPSDVATIHTPTTTVSQHQRQASVAS